MYNTASALESVPTGAGHTDLVPLVGKTFIKERFGQRTVVILRDIKKRKVQLQYPDRADSFTLAIEEFRKYFRRPD